MVCPSQVLLDPFWKTLYPISLLNRYKAAGNYYIKVMNKIVEKGESYVTNEIARLERMLGKWWASSW